jgi:hypothetical protein
MRVLTISEKTNVQEIQNVDDINIFYQYFVHPDKERALEIKKCLKYNVKNKHVTKIYLLNERIYNEEELGISHDKIVQIDIKNRVKFKDIYEYIYEHNIKGYNILINSDIFFDETISNLFKSDIHINKKMYALLRYECIDESNYRETSPLFGDRGDSQDTWIVHSNFTFGKKECKIFNFEFGKPGCDNKMTYLMSTLGFEILNDPEFIKTYHLHSTNIRNYTSDDRVCPPYEIVMPKSSYDKIIEVNPSYGNTYELKYNHKHGNNKLFEYISDKINKGQNFIIPRVAGIENNFAIFQVLLSIPDYNEHHAAFSNYLEISRDVMKNNAGVKITSAESVQKYSNLYLEAFSNCELYAGWAPGDGVYSSIQTSHSVLDNIFNSKDSIYAESFDIYHHIYTRPWTYALKNKRILMISNFEESIQSKIQTRKEIYGVDLFPGCEIITIRPPLTQGNEESEEFDIELLKFISRLEKIHDQYDIALVSCGGYGNLVCSYLYKTGKSAIYIGGVLQMYWGILGSRWFNDRPDIIRLFLNKSWNRPKESEKPKNHTSIEGSCYW